MKPFCRVVLLLALLHYVAPAGADENAEITPDVVYGHKHGLAMTFDVYQPKANANGAGVLFIVSGGWYSRWHPPQRGFGLIQPILKKGFTVFAVRHGSSPKFTIPEIVEDVRRSVRFIRLHADKFGVDPQRLGVCGASAGGHLSLVLGTTADEGDAQADDRVLRASSRVAAVVAYFPPTDIRPWVNEQSPYYKNYPALRFSADQAGDYSPVLHASPDDAPTLLVHGDKDELVPIDHSERILAEFKQQKVPCELLVIEGAAHGFRGEDGKRAGDALVAWFAKHLLNQ